jgi:chorismate dehydratase
MSEPTANTPAATPAPKPAATAAPAATASPAAAPAAAPAAPASPQPVKFTAKPMKIGIFNFLNIQPLIWDMKNHHKLIPAAPSQMGDLLKLGRLDVAIAPIVVKFLNPELQIVPGAAIGCKGPVKSVRLLSHVPLNQVTRLFADSRSQTSVLLTRLILRKWYGVKKLEVKHVEMPDFKPNQTRPWEASLQIGDIALESAPSGMNVLDLGEEWYLRTQKPFVFAVWMARNVEIAREIQMDLVAAKNEGIKHYQEIADNYPGIWVFHRPQAKEYLEKNIDYTYTATEVQGHLEFEKLLKEEGLIF